MCGRYSIAVENPGDIEERFGATFAEAFVPRYNAAPSQRLPAILNSDPTKIVLSAWGLKPAWMTKNVRHDGLINVRLETLQEKHTFQKNLEERRCLIPADGFYEWKKSPDGTKVPFRIVREDHKPFAFVGIWDDAAEGKNELPRFAIVTTAANAFMQPIHSRMPVILSKKEEQAWLAHQTRGKELLDLLANVAEQPLMAYEVSRLVNKATEDNPEVLAPVNG